MVKIAQTVLKAAAFGLAAFVWALSACVTEPDPIHGGGGPATLCDFAPPEGSDIVELARLGDLAASWIKSNLGCDTCVRAQCGPTNIIEACSRCTDIPEATFWIGVDCSLTPPSGNYRFAVHDELVACYRLEEPYYE